MPERSYVEVQVAGVGNDITNRPVVLLKDDADRKLPIWIGQCEAIAIVQRLKQDFDPQRPLTQDLTLNVWKRLGATLTELRIDDLWQSVYYSKLAVERDGQTIDLDCRPSDGIAMALAAGVPIFVAEHVLEAADSEDEDG